MMANIIVTGGSGFIGSNLVGKLLENPENQVTVLDNISSGETMNLKEFEGNGRYRFIKGDITDAESLKNILTKDIDKVYHLAAVVGIKHYIRSPLRLIDVNVLGAKNVFELCQKNEIKVLFTSTSEIFGKNPEVPWKEEDDRVLGSTSVDRWNYSTSKALCEHMLFAMNRVNGFPMTIVRYFNIYGPKQQPYFVASQSIQKVLNNQRPLLYDRGNQTRCFTYVDDAIKGTIMAAESRKADGEAFNIGSSKEDTMKDIINMIIELAGKKGVIEPEDLDTKKHYGKTYEDLPRRIPDVTKAKEILGWELTTPVEQGLKKTIEWARNNKWWLDLSN